MGRHFSYRHILLRKFVHLAYFVYGIRPRNLLKYRHNTGKISAVSYTHLALPTKLEVVFAGGGGCV